jgi:4-hydroxy-3-methylbut-2-enyl diphosphate reductase
MSGKIMEVLLAEEYGFCFGVERAVDMVEEAVTEGGTIRSLGALIHNAQEMERLEGKGVATISTPSEADSETVAVIRAHGVTPQVQRELEARAAHVIDATCPFVTRVQHLAERAAAQGRDVVVAGNPDHPEMIGVVGYAPDNTYVVRDASEVARLPLLHAPLVVSQTTIKLQTFLDVAEAVREHADAEPQIVNTICSATRDRQDAARALAGQVDAFYVIAKRAS